MKAVPHRFKSAFSALGVTLCCSLLIGCVAQTATPTPTQPAEAQGAGGPANAAVGRVIVKFKDAALRPDAAEVVGALAHDSKARVRYARALGAGAHLYEIEGLSDQAALQAAVKAIAARPDVEFAEIDRLMKPLNGGSTR